jgi:hypothetical protein
VLPSIYVPGALREGGYFLEAEARFFAQFRTIGQFKQTSPLQKAFYWPDHRRIGQISFGNLDDGDLVVIEYTYEIYS